MLSEVAITIARLLPYVLAYPNHIAVSQKATLARVINGNMLRNSVVSCHSDPQVKSQSSIPTSDMTRSQKSNQSNSISTINLRTMNVSTSIPTNLLSCVLFLSNDNEAPDQASLFTPALYHITE